MHAFANPAKFMRFTRPLRPWVAALACVAYTAGLYVAFFASPEDYQQGGTVRIMYVHVPAAWMAVFGYGALALSSIAYLIWKHPLADFSARALAPVGTAFTLICLITGALWGKPMWGAWWVWDARLTSVLILFMLYIGYMIVATLDPHNEKTGIIAAVIAIVGAVNLPIIKFSVDWWNTLHQPASILRMDGPTIDSSMLLPLFIMIGAFTLTYMLVWHWQLERLLMERKIRHLQWRALSATQRANEHEEEML